MDMGSGSMSGMNSDSGSMGGMGGMGGMGSCSTHMTGNWQTIGICILSPSWHIKTAGQFAGSCIGIFLIVVLIEMTRRFGREWDRYIVRSERFHNQQQHLDTLRCQPPDMSPISSELDEKRVSPPAQELDAALYGYPARAGVPGSAGKFWARDPRRFHPSLIQQSVRSLVYAVQFTGAYLVMLMAMTFNGYILMSICLGGLFGHFISTWDVLAFDLTENPCLYVSGSNGGVVSGPDGGTGLNVVAEPALRTPADKELAAGQAADASYGHGGCCN